MKNRFEIIFTDLNIEEFCGYDISFISNKFFVETSMGFFYIDTEFETNCLEQPLKIGDNFGSKTIVSVYPYFNETIMYPVWVIEVEK